MYYKKKEEYHFTIPREYKAYLAFKDKLRNAGITYLDEGGNMNQILSVTTRGTFDVDDKCDILELVKEEK